MIRELAQELWLDTPKGEGLVLFVTDRGPHSDLEWTVVIVATGEIWSVKNLKVKVAGNWVQGVKRKTPVYKFENDPSAKLREAWETANKNSGFKRFQEIMRPCYFVCPKEGCNRQFNWPFLDGVPCVGDSTSGVCGVEKHLHCARCDTPYGAPHDPKLCSSGPYAWRIDR